MIDRPLCVARPSHAPPDEQRIPPAPLPRPDIAGSCNRITRCRRRMGIAVDILYSSSDPTVFENIKLNTVPTNSTLSTLCLQVMVQIIL